MLLCYAPQHHLATPPKTTNTRQETSRVDTHPVTTIRINANVEDVDKICSTEDGRQSIVRNNDNITQGLPSETDEEETSNQGLSSLSRCGSRRLLEQAMKRDTRVSPCNLDGSGPQSKDSGSCATETTSVTSDEGTNSQDGQDSTEQELVSRLRKERDAARQETLIMSVRMAEYQAKIDSLHEELREERRRSLQRKKHYNEMKAELQRHIELSQKRLSMNGNPVSGMHPVVYNSSSFSVDDESIPDGVTRLFL